MIMLERIANLPSNTIFKVRTAKEPCKDADYVFYHKSLKFYSCYFNVPVVELKRKKRKNAEVVE